MSTTKEPSLLEDNWRHIISFLPSTFLLKVAMRVSKLFSRLSKDQICHQGLSLNTTAIKAEPPTWLTSLSGLEVNNCKENLEYLSNLTNLTSFSMTDSKSRPANRIHLRNCTKLQNLRVVNCEGTSANQPDLFLVVADLPHLTSLTVRANTMDGKPVRYMPPMTKLQYLELGGIDFYVVEEPPESWLNLRRLETLVLINSNFDQDWIATCAKMTALKFLSLDVDLFGGFTTPPGAKLDVTPLTNLTRLQMNGSAKKMPQAWPRNLPSVGLICNDWDNLKIENKNIFEKTKLHYATIQLTRRLKEQGVVLKGRINMLGFALSYLTDVTMDEILEIDPEIFQVLIAKIADEEIATFTSLFGKTTRMPKRTRLLIRLTDADTKSAEFYERLLAILPDRSKVEVHWT